MSHDLVIRNGYVIDGSGLPRIPADVAVDDGRIVQVGTVPERGREEIDAEGHAVTPGFIDGHTHMDAQVMWDPLGRCSCYHGVTSVVMGNCGFTLAPAAEADRGFVVRNFERAEDISATSIREGITRWDWSSFPEYLDALDRVPKGINYAANIGHSALRTWVMGERAFEEPGRAPDLERMADELRGALRAGAIGFTTSRSVHHLTSDDRPVASRLATWDEIRILVDVMGRTGSGIFQLAMGEDVRVADPDERHRALERFRQLAVETRAPVVFNVFPTSADGADWKDQLELFDSAAASGGRMYGMTSSRGLSTMLSFQTRLPFDILPVWRELRSEPLERQRQLLQDPQVRARLVEVAHTGRYGNDLGPAPRTPEYDRIEVLDRSLPPHPVVSVVARERSVDPVELMIDLALQHDFELFFLQPLSRATPEFLLESMSHPRTVMTFSDSGAHVSQVMDSSIQTHFLAYWVRELQAFTLERAVHMITYVPATVWGFADRGLVREGFVADLNVLDPERLDPGMPVLRCDLPGGAPRLDQRATGILATVVNGQVLLRDGEHTGVLPGRLLRARGGVAR
jgi:N-acyl-D-aspartate/D-glutamate deacylase